MGWSAGTYTKGNAGTGGWAGDQSLGITIEASRHDTQDNDFATGINQCLNKDGSNAATGNLNLGGFLPTNLGAGTAAAVAIAAGNDVNTGIFSPAADNWAVATNGSERIRVDSTGQLGVGTTTPSTRVEISETTNTTNIVKLTNTSNGAAATSAVYFRNDTNNPAAFVVQNSSANATLGGAGSFNIGTNVAAPLTFHTNAVERFRAASDGKIGIGNTTPSVFIDTQRDANDSLTRFRIYNATSGASAQTQIDLGNNTNQSAVNLFLNSSANTGNAGANAFHIFNGLSAPIRMRAGSTGGVDLASGATSWAAVSDERLKKNVQPLAYGLSEVVQLEPVRFDYKDDESEDSKRIGFIAQQVKPVIPEAVTGSEETFYGMSAAELVPVLVNAIKQLEARVAALES